MNARRSAAAAGRSDRCSSAARMYRSMSARGQGVSLTAGGGVARIGWTDFWQTSFGSGWAPRLALAKDTTDKTVAIQRRSTRGRLCPADVTIVLLHPRLRLPAPV